MIDSNTLSEPSKIDFKTSSNAQQYNIEFHHAKQNPWAGEIIQKGFQLNQEGKISLKKYYESTQEHSLFQSKGYSIKYETIRKITLFKQFKF